MASSRYDDFKYYDGSWKVPSQVKVYNGSSWIDYGEKTSSETKQIQYHNGSAWKNALYNRTDINLPGYVQLGSDKYIDLRFYKNSSATTSYPMYFNTSASGYSFELDTTVKQNSALYTVYFKGGNTGYINYWVEVSSAGSAKFCGQVYLNQLYTKCTTTTWSVSSYPRVVIKVTRTGGNVSAKPDVFKVYDKNTGNEIASGQMWTAAIAAADTDTYSYNPIYHRLGSKTTNTNGTQSVYGNAIIHRLKFTPYSDRNVVVDIDFETASNGNAIVYANDPFVINRPSNPINGLAFAQLVGCTVTRITNTTWTKP